MAQIKKLQIDDETLYPVTIPQAVVDPDSNKTTREELDGKVDKVTGKQLSTEDYTTAEKSKVTNLPLNTTSELALKFDKANLESTRSKSTTKAPTSKLVDDLLTNGYKVDSIIAASHNNISLEKFEYSTYDNNTLLKADGTTQTLAGYRTTAFLTNANASGYRYFETVFPAIANSYASVAYYDSSNNFIKSFTFVGKKLITVPNGYNLKICSNTTIYEVISLQDIATQDAIELVDRDKQRLLNQNYRAGTILPRCNQTKVGASAVPIVNQVEIGNPDSQIYVTEIEIYPTTTFTSIITNTGVITPALSKFGIGFWYDYDAAEAIESIQSNATLIHYIKTNGVLATFLWKIIGTVGLERIVTSTTTEVSTSMGYKIIEKKIISGRTWAFVSFKFTVNYLTSNTTNQDWVFGFSNISQTMKNNAIKMLIANTIILYDIDYYLTAYNYADISYRNQGLIGAKQTNNPLWNKIIAACGDSITNGINAGIDSVTGDYLSWAHFVAKRNNATWINYGISGSTMQDIPTKNGFSNATRYQNIDARADFIVLWFGVNDAAYGSLGTITDTDPTGSFFGGYNTVLSYLLTNHPDAKICMIVQYGSNAGLRQAVRDLGKKWGVAALDLYDESAPLVFDRESGSTINSTVVSNWKSTYLTDGTHPNELGAKYIASIIEGFLKKI